MKKIGLIIQKELTENLSKKTLLSFFIFFIIYAGYLNFLSLDIYKTVSSNVESSPQIIMSADPNQGIIAPLFANFFLLFLFVFPVIISTTISGEKENMTYDILQLYFKPSQIIIGKFSAYLLLSILLFFLTFLLLFPYIISGGYLDILYIINLICGFITISFLWISLSIFISSITPQQVSFYIIIVFNLFLIGIDFISDVINLNILDSFKNLIPYNFYDKILSGIFNLEFYLGYIFTALLLLQFSLFKLKQKKYSFYFLSTFIFFLLLIILNNIDYKRDFTFNKINSLSNGSIKVLNKIKNKNVIVNIYIKPNAAKWQTANDLIKLYKLNFHNIKFNFLDPELYGVEYGIIKFKGTNGTAKTLSIDEDIFTQNIYYVSTGEKISINTKRKIIGYPYKFEFKNKIFYLIWIIILIFSIIIIRKIILKGGIKI